MNIAERIALGRKCAYGIDRMIDIDLAYEMWQGIDYLLSDEDRETFDYIKECAEGESDCCDFGNVSTPVARRISVGEHTEEDVRELFARLIDEARLTGDVETLYRALKRCEKSETVAEPEQKSEKKHCFGNNLKYLIYHYWLTVGHFHDEMNRYREKNNLPKRSLQLIYQAIKGTNGLGDDNKMIIVAMTNFKNSSRGGLVRPMTVQDLELPHDSFLGLFVSPRCEML